MKVTIFCLLSILGLNAFSQDTIPPTLHIEETGDSVRLSATLRPLRQIAGAPSAFYSYFWELGDGHFSFDKAPAYAYRDTGTYAIRLYATNNYDDGKAPPTRPRKVRIKKKSLTKDAWVSHFFHGSGDVELKINRYPKPGEDFVAILGYRNQYQDSLSGNIVLFYNDRQLDRQGFSLAEQRFYHREDHGNLESLTARVDRQALQEEVAFESRAHGPMIGADDAPGGANGAVARVFEDFSSETQSMLHSLEDNYSSHAVVHFHSIARGTEQFVFMDMNTLPEMLQDTNATVGLSAMLVPDDPGQPPQLYALDMQVVSSHDPNRMMLRSRRINYRFFKQKKELLYRVEFQNTGTGPARHISVGLAIPHQLDPESIRLNAMRPVCKWCDSTYARASCIDTIRHGDSIYFVFDNIYLPGIQQDGVGDKDSTTGFVEYAIRFKRKPKKIPFSTQAAIAFDRQTPLVTNKATARFIKGLSPGIMVGYSVLPGNGGYTASGPLQFGYVLAPYSPFRPYFQVEAFVGLLQQDAFTSTIVKDNSDTLIGGLPFIITGRQTKTTVNRNSFELTPLHFRYNIGKYFGVGAGAMAQINISEQTTTENRAYFVTDLLSQNIHTAVSTTKSAVTYLGSVNAAPFIDVQFGAVRHGPVAGIRYMHLLKGDVTNRFWLYAGFKL
ncbi:MAG TPA: PKD domain-containing protein [Puia sp.]|nr:PKD domain-containing protein [Puia sp.]